MYAPAASPTESPVVIYVERLLGVLAATPERICLKLDARETSAGELRASIHRYARALEAAGLGRGDVVALFATNCPDALAVRYAASLIGAGSCFLSAPPTAEARAALIASIDPQLLVVFPETAALVPTGVAVPLAGIGIAPPGGFDLRASAACLSDAPVACRARPGDLGIITSSGGSTGVPKASWRSFATYSHMIAVPSPADRRQLVNGPLAYLSQVLVDLTLLGGGCVVLRERYEAVDTAATIEAEGITDLFLVEPQLFELMDHPVLRSTDLSSLRTLTHIGASAPPTLRRRARERFGPRIVHVYGASEEGLVSMLAPTENASDAHLRSAGHPLPAVELRFRRADGSLAGRGETGSIEIRSPSMAQGYRHRPELEARAFRDGWFRSGDLGRLDAKGCLQILGRAVDIVQVEGRLISPTLLEDTLCRVPGVRYASVVIDAQAGRRIAVVLPQRDACVDEVDCIDAIAAEHGAAVARSMRLVMRESVPLTLQGKPDREAIRALGRATSAAVAVPV